MWKSLARLHHFTKLESWGHKITLISPLVTDMPVIIHESERRRTCVQWTATYVCIQGYWLSFCFHDVSIRFRNGSRQHGILFFHFVTGNTKWLNFNWFRNLFLFSLEKKHRFGRRWLTSISTWCCIIIAYWIVGLLNNCCHYSDNKILQA